MEFQAYNNAFYELDHGKYILRATEKSDMIVDAITGNITANAAWIGIPVKGDFVVSAKVSHDFLSVYDAGALIAYHSDTLWAKACFECAEAKEHMVVSVMTDGRSDDANAVEIQENEVWLQLIRKGNNIAVHYSKDGKNWKFVRILYIDFPEEVSVGMLVQSPLGNGGEVTFADFSLRRCTVTNLRMGE